MRVLAIVHQRDAGPGVFAEAVKARGDELVEWLPPEAPPPALTGVGAAMVLGGAMHVDHEDRHAWLGPEKRLLRGLLRSELPLLGVCLGAQLVAEAAGARPRPARSPEIGWHEVRLTPAARGDPLIGPLPARFEAFGWHSYEAPLPPRGVALAHSSVCLQAFRVGARAWGIQFHAEVTSADLRRWLDGYESDPDAVRIGLDVEAVRAEAERRIDDWNRVGRGIALRFLDAAARPSGAYSGVR